MSFLSKIFGKDEKQSATGQLPPATLPISGKTSKKPLKRKPPRRLTEAERDAAISLIKAAIRSNGYKTMSVSKLLYLFGYHKRSAENIKQISAWLAAHHLTIYPELSLHLKPAEAIRIYGFPVAQLGNLFASAPEAGATAGPKPLRQQRERELEEYIKQHGHYQQLGLCKPKRQHSPLHTRDRFDFLCEDQAGNPVVLELKHRGGGKAAVEQVLRYMGMLKQESPAGAVRGILVTGIRDVDTAKALHGMTPEQQACIEWHLYRFDQLSGSLSFERVAYEFIAHHLQLAHSL